MSQRIQSRYGLPVYHTEAHCFCDKLADLTSFISLAPLCSSSSLTILTITSVVWAWLHSVPIPSLAVESVSRSAGYQHSSTARLLRKTLETHNRELLKHRIRSKYRFNYFPLCVTYSCNAEQQKITPRSFARSRNGGLLCQRLTSVVTQF